ncbi:MAG: UDP-N-acetylglucosamine 1-carboxyvinyltransferase [Elusimicrobiota bacterium]
MDKFVIEGGRPLRGTLRVNGSKNAALPILIATLLTDEACVIENVPDLRDIRTTIRLLESLGKRVAVEGKVVRVEFGRRLRTRAPYELVKQMRASVLVAGPLLARFGRARVPLPGGCAIGLRPVDIHLKAFQALGAKADNAGGDVVFSARRLRPARVKFRFASVGATENILMAAAATPGRTIIENAAREPEIDDLARFLGAMGAKISGAGKSRIVIEGVSAPAGVRHRVISDRIETGTLLIAGAAARGPLTLVGAEPGHLGCLLRALAKSGARVRQTADGLCVTGPARPRPVSITTGIYPGFPTDLQAQWMAYMCRARGKSSIREAIFERRFMHAAELARLGARIAFRGNCIIVTGVPRLQGASIMASDIRAGAALVTAGLAAEGVTEIHRVYHIDRGYERIERLLRRAGARMRRVRA